jgi:uncharacterized protein
MLITFKISNFLSFDTGIAFSMRAGQTRELPSHYVAGKGRNGIDILKSALLYGANASGKSNFIKAIEFVKNLVYKGLENTATENKYFRLNANSSQSDTTFEIEFKCGEKMYAYGAILSLATRKVKEEWLFELLKTTDKPIFERVVLPDGQSDLSISINASDKEGKKRFDVYKQDVKDTQLFLTEIAQKNLANFPSALPFKLAFDWISNDLVVIYPNTKFSGLDFVGNDEDMKAHFCHFLSLFNTGVSAIETIETDIEGQFAPNVVEAMLNDLNKKEAMGIIVKQGRDSFTILKDKKDPSKLKSLRLNTQRNIQNSNDLANFDIAEESDGTQRIMDFIPALLGLSRSHKTYIIDEIDRSLHPELTQKILELFFAQSEDTESQLIATTHESNLLNLELLRRDEIWFAEKDSNGASHIYSLEEFKPRADKEVRRAYLQGRFGALPFIADVRKLGWFSSIPLPTKNSEDAQRTKRSSRKEI